MDEGVGQVGVVNVDVAVYWLVYLILRVLSTNHTMSHLSLMLLPCQSKQDAQNAEMDS